MAAGAGGVVTAHAWTVVQKQSPNFFTGRILACTLKRMSEKAIPSQDRPVIVVGAGLSGLYAAKVLNHYNVPVKVLEAQDRVGGRSYTEETPIKGGKPAKVDHGAGYIGSSQSMVKQLCNDFGITLQRVPDYREGKYTFSLNKEVRHSYNPLADLFDYLKPVEFLAMAVTMIKTWSLGLTIPYDSPWTAPKAKKWDAMNVDHWLDICFPGDLFKNARTMFEFVCRTPLGIEPSETSLLYFLWYIRSADSLFSLLFFAQDNFVIGGTQQISKRLSSGLALELSHPVAAIHHDESGVLVTANRDEFQGDRVLLATTPHLRTRITYDPLISPMHQQLCQRSPMGTTIKVHVFYSEHIWKEAGFNGNCTIFDATSVGQIYDVSEPGSNIFCLQGFYVGNAGRAATLKTEEQRKSDVTHEFQRVFGGSEAFLNPIGYAEYIWDNSTYVGGAPVGTCATGTLTNFGRALRERFDSDRIHYAGTETSTQWAGYMEGALRAGKRAAYELLDEYGIVHDPIEKPASSLSEEKSKSLMEFLKYAALASSKIVASAKRTFSVPVALYENTAENNHPQVLEYLTRHEDFNNTGNWLGDYLDQNQAAAINLYAGVHILNDYKEQYRLLA